jgi:hypothetical protein
MVTLKTPAYLALSYLLESRPTRFIQTDGFPVIMALGQLNKASGI